MKPINIVLDLDCTLVQALLGSDNSAEKLIDKGCIDKTDIVYACEYAHYLYPFYKEFIKYVMSLTNNRLIFFSNGAAIRNEELIPKLLENALGKERFAEIKQNVKIYSRDHEIDTTRLSDSEEDKYQPDPKQYGCMYGQMKKDLRVVVEDESQLSYTVLVDDDYSYVTKGQERNLLFISGSEIDVLTLEEYKIRDFVIDSIDSRDLDEFSTVNKLIYAAGVLQSANEIYQKEDQALTDILWPMQFAIIPEAEKSIYGDRVDFWYGQKKKEFYYKGAETLKNYN
jgi:hypothetical protein